MRIPSSFNHVLVSFFSAVLLLISVSTRLSGQVVARDTLRTDSVPEIIVYEDDTLYVAPDTIRITDTIVHLIHEKVPIRVRKKEAGVYFTPFYTGFSRLTLQSDSLTLHTTMNYRSGIQFSYYAPRFAWYLQAGYESVHNKIQYSHSYMTTGEELSGVYDSLFVKSNHQINNYFDFVYIQLGLGKRWEFKRYTLSIYTSGMYSFMYKQTCADVYNELIERELSPDSRQKSSLSAGLQIDMGYKITRSLLLHAIPTYQYQFVSEKKYPQGDAHRLGVTFGMSVLF
ncbi:MAG TPA: hypothetical protein VHO90_05030 [Bacteroidales bacterium]|nr:hypothetical protein [Bacteroidales bacterium]